MLIIQLICGASPGVRVKHLFAGVGRSLAVANFWMLTANGDPGAACLPSGSLRFGTESESFHFAVTFGIWCADGNNSPASVPGGEEGRRGVTFLLSGS